MRNNNPKSHPACFIANGRLSRPIPISTLTELKIVCGRVDCPTMMSSWVPSSCWTCLTSNGPRSKSPDPSTCTWGWCSRWNWIACLRVDSLIREEMVPYEVAKVLSNDEASSPVLGSALLEDSGACESSSSWSESESPRSRGRSTPEFRPQDGVLLGPYSWPVAMANSSSECAETNDDRRGRTSGKAAALCQDRAKLSILLGPPA